VCLFRHHQPASVLDWLDSAEGQQRLKNSFRQLRAPEVFAWEKDDIDNAGPESRWQPHSFYMAMLSGTDGYVAWIEPMATDETIGRPCP
jgi:hypothetical protein